jgi:hypothetical protein
LLEEERVGLLQRRAAAILMIVAGLLVGLAGVCLGEAVHATDGDPCGAVLGVAVLAFGSLPLLGRWTPAGLRCPRSLLEDRPSPPPRS